jgi:hypothetical protein
LFKHTERKKLNGRKRVKNNRFVVLCHQHLEKKQTNKQMAHARTRKSHTEGGEEEEGGKKKQHVHTRSRFFFF